jgi:hypothetical protein
MISQGFETMQMGAFGEFSRSLGMIKLMIFTFLSTKERRDSPTFCATPAVTITRWDPFEIL